MAVPRGTAADDRGQTTGGLGYLQMIEAAKKSHFWHALWQIAKAIADLFAEVSFLVPDLRQMPSSNGPTWPELTQRWTAS